MGWVLTFSIQKDHRSQKSEVDEAQLAAQGIYSQLPRVILTLPPILPLHAFGLSLQALFT